jgi:hypothetical protein
MQKDVVKQYDISPWGCESSIVEARDLLGAVLKAKQAKREYVNARPWNGQPEFNPELKCSVVSLDYDLDKHIGTLHIARGESCNMAW